MKTDLRSRILEASADLLSEGGLSALSMREVARRAGVSHQAPYHYFPDREAILAELVTGGFEQLHAYEVRAIDGLTDRLDRVTAIGEAYVRFALDHPSIFQLMFRKEMVHSERFAGLQSTAEQAFAVPHSVVSEACGKPMSECLPEMLACWSMVHGMATLLLEGKMDRHLGSSPADQIDMVRTVMRTYAIRAYGE